MKRIAIFTAGNAGKKIYQLVKSIEDVEVVCFVDNNANLYAKLLEEIPIVSPYKLKKIMSEESVDCLLVPSDRMISYGLKEYTAQLDELEIDRYKIVPSYMIRKTDIVDDDIEKIKILIYEGEYKKINQLQHLQFHVIDNCNLNCKRCQHFSNIASKESYADFKSLERDFKRLEELFDDINTIAMLGGEPLLNPELSKYCYMIRKYFPNARIEIITNGLLIRKMEDELMEAIRENNVLVNISYYPVLKNYIEDIVRFLAQNNIRYIVGSEIKYFSKRLLDKKSSLEAEEVFKTCRDASCTTLRNGKLYPCYLPATIHLFNDKFKKNIGCDNSSIDIYDVSVSGVEIVERLKRKFDICSYCGKEEVYKWEQCCVANENDWLVE